MAADVSAESLIKEISVVLEKKPAPKPKPKKTVQTKPKKSSSNENTETFTLDELEAKTIQSTMPQFFNSTVNYGGAPMMMSYVNGAPVVVPVQTAAPSDETDAEKTKRLSTQLGSTKDIPQNLDIFQQIQFMKQRLSMLTEKMRLDRDFFEDKEDENEN